MSFSSASRSAFAALFLLVLLLVVIAGEVVARETCSVEAGRTTCDAAVARNESPSLAMLQTQALQGTATLPEHDLKSTDDSVDIEEPRADVEEAADEKSTGTGGSANMERPTGDDGEVTSPGEATSEEEASSVEEDDTSSDAGGAVEERAVTQGASAHTESTGDEADSFDDVGDNPSEGASDNSMSSDVEDKEDAAVINGKSVNEHNKLTDVGAEAPEDETDEDAAHDEEVGQGSSVTHDTSSHEDNNLAAVSGEARDENSPIEHETPASAARERQEDEAGGDTSDEPASNERAAKDLKVQKDDRTLADATWKEVSPPDEDDHDDSGYDEYSPDDELEDTVDAGQKQVADNDTSAENVDIILESKHASEKPVTTHADAPPKQGDTKSNDGAKSGAPPDAHLLSEERAAAAGGSENRAGAPSEDDAPGPATDDAAAEEASVAEDAESVDPEGDADEVASQADVEDNANKDADHMPSDGSEQIKHGE